DRPARQQHAPGLRPVQPGQRPQQHRLAGARAAGDAQHLARHHVQAQVVVHALRAKAVDDAAGAEQGRRLHSPTFSKNTENSASSTITRKIALTTARVVSRPTLSAEPAMRSPCMQPITPMKKANTGAFARPTKRSLLSTALCTRSR